MVLASGEAQIVRTRPARRRVEKQYTYKEAADLLSVSVATIRRWIREGRIYRVTHLSKTAPRIPESVLAELLNTPVDGPAAAPPPVARRQPTAQQVTRALSKLPRPALDHIEGLVSFLEFKHG